ncbi:MAG: flagellar biosynthetic protein FliR [Armatimonadota bacterium]|nr:MAG: flagellar biosynthetic protein FliR [Armatimonadota bacterium]
MLRLTIDLPQIAGHLLLLCRVGGVTAVAPLVGSERVPARLKAALAVMVALVLAPTVDRAPEGGTALEMGLAAAGELVLGLGLGFGARLIFAAVQMAGELADMQSAFGFAGVVSPQTGERTSVIGQLQISVAWLVFLAADGHHAVLRGLGASVVAVPLGTGSALCGPALTQVVGSLIATSVRIAAPIVGAVILADFALGLLTRAAPQMNLLAIGFPVKLAVGLGATLLALPLLVSAERGLVAMMEGIVTAVRVGGR